MRDLQIAHGDLELVCKILHAHVPELEVWAYGSRVHGENLKPFSDLDLALITSAPLDAYRLTRLKDAFVESALPFKVDLLDWSTTDEKFQQKIKQHYRNVQQAGTSMEINT
jgi:predicted nucleotidyltransferase